MQRWEYRIVFRSEYAGGWFCDGKPAEEYAHLDDPEVLRRLGEEGWELVAVEGYTYFFKRPLPPGA
ncbi:MAG: DUF4177 domain-containing protein [Armatimonadota bacterium]|nr:DUF4177 domain-containing protein [Armatimonadota bacterium]